MYVRIIRRIWYYARPTRPLDFDVGTKNLSPSRTRARIDARESASSTQNFARACSRTLFVFQDVSLRSRARSLFSFSRLGLVCLWCLRSCRRRCGCCCCCCCCCFWASVFSCELRPGQRRRSACACPSFIKVKKSVFDRTRETESGFSNVYRTVPCSFIGLLSRMEFPTLNS